MLKEQRWSPDTCGCVLLETWDDAVDAAARTHTFRAIETTCPAHTGIPAIVIYDTIRGENRRKNLIEVMAKSIRSSYVHEDYTWSFDAQRRLVITVAGLTVAQRNALQAAADVQFGPGMVVLQ